jgi:hypothetical protein
MTMRTSQLGFFVCALVALGVYCLMFEFRYLWYVEAEQATLMRSVFAGSVALIVLLWAIFPSRIAVAAIVIAGLFFPHAIFDADARPLLGRGLDLPAIAMSAVAVLLLVFATYLRQKTKRTR